MIHPPIPCPPPHQSPVLLEARAQPYPCLAATSPSPAHPLQTPPPPPPLSLLLSLLVTIIARAHPTDQVASAGCNGTSGQRRTERLHLLATVVGAGEVARRRARRRRCQQMEEPLSGRAGAGKTAGRRPEVGVQGSGRCAVAAADGRKRHSRPGRSGSAVGDAQVSFSAS